MCPQRKIVVVPYDPAWPAAFQREAERIACVFGDELLSIHHIGSTSVPGLAAKPIIDVMPLVRDVERVALYSPAMIELGYEPKGEHGIAGRRFFTKGRHPHRTHNVHIYHPSSPEVARHLAFRDYLRAHPAEAEQYARLKAELACQFPNDIEQYMAGKEPFIKELLRKAQMA
ncbi:MAG: GrpB family protein [Ardenticatenaceae bacterium]